MDEIAAGRSKPRVSLQIFASLLPAALLFAAWPLSLPAQDAQAPAPSAATSAPTYAQQTPDQLQQLVAPIALYPDSLVAQILAASTFPEQIVLAERWVQAHADLKGDALGQAVGVAGRGLREVQTGQLRTYILFLVLTVLATLGILLTQVG